MEMAIRDKNGNEIKVGDIIKVHSIEKPDVLSVGPITAINQAGEGEEITGMVAWTRMGNAIEKAHFRVSECELILPATFSNADKKAFVFDMAKDLIRRFGNQPANGHPSEALIIEARYLTEVLKGET